MGIVKNEIGNTYHNLTVIERAPNKNNRAQWICKCKCGNTTIVDGKSLRNGNTKSCGCLNKTKEIGKKYNKLTVISYSHTNDRGELIWKCICDCGNTTTAKSRDLHSGHKKSCGCIYSPDLSGKRFGRLTVLKRNKISRQWECQCDCGNIVHVSTSNLNCGNTSSCGCINYSIGEKNIADWLTNHNIKYKKEWKIPKTYYRFDFAILDEENRPILFIEFDGEQHYTDVKGVWGYNTEGLEEVKKRDMIKNQYAIDNKIMLVRIPYWERDNINKDTIFNPNYFVCFG